MHWRRVLTHTWQLRLRMLRLQQGNGRCGRSSYWYTGLCVTESTSGSLHSCRISNVCFVMAAAQHNDA